MRREEGWGWVRGEERGGTKRDEGRGRMEEGRGNREEGGGEMRT
jgi:hypothetical protein